MDLRKFIYTEDDEDLSLLPKEPSPSFGTGSLSVSVNTEPLKSDEELVIRPAEVTAKSKESLNPKLFLVHLGSVAAWIKDKKYKTRGWSSRPPDDVPYLTVSNDDEGLLDVLELKHATACHLKIFIVIEKLRGEFDVMKDMERVREEECKELRAKCEVAMTEFEKNPTVVALRENISTLSTLVKEHKVILNRILMESQKWVGYHQSLLTLKSKVTSLDAKKASLKAVKVLVSSPILYGRCRVYEQVADMKDPFDLSKVNGYRSSYKKDHSRASNDLATATFPWLDEFVADPPGRIEVLLSKKPPSLQRCSPSRTQVPLPSSQRATPSLVLVFNPMSPPTDVFVVKPQSTQL
uniref:Uncharacterized protein n=1 Tax=Tanacetum cinerariifolium TaxID=118510 RepID=A0A699L9J1_TANCI|nr:hypothetical protein [Tanacetum cinerariifolium]